MRLIDADKLLSKLEKRRGYIKKAQESEMDRLYDFASNREYHERTHDEHGFYHCKVTAEDMCSKMCYRSDIYRNHDNRLFGEIEVSE